MNIAKQIAEELKIKVWQVEAVMELTGKKNMVR